MITEQDLERAVGPLAAAGDDPAGARRAAVAMVLRFERGEPSILLMQRAARDGDRWSGQVSLPGGHEEEGDEDLVRTAVRETREEVGVDLDASARLVGALDRVQARARGGLLGLWIRPFVFATTRAVALEPGPEAEDAFWMPLAPVLRGELDSQYRYQDERRRLFLPCWRFEGRVVWGLTHRMVSTLLAAARPR